MRVERRFGAEVEPDKGTHPKHGGIIMNIPPGCRFIDCQIFYFRCTEDDVGVWFLYGRNELSFRPVFAKTIDASANAKRKKRDEGRRMVSEGRQRNDPHGFLRSRTMSRSSIYIRIGFIMQREGQGCDVVTYRRVSVPMEYTGVKRRVQKRS